ncbi:MAG: GNAT family N-acetyltransferase [Alkaliphilus sp.]
MRYDVEKNFEKLEEAGIDTYGLRVNMSINQNIHNFFVGNDDTEKYILVELTLENNTYKDNEEFTEIYGSAYGRLITTYDQVNGRALNYLEVIDSIDQDTYNCLSVFMDENCGFNDELMFDKLFYIDQIIISEKYRDKGLGSILLEYIKYRFADITTAVVLQPLAFECKDESSEVFGKESEHLYRFYEKHGFKNYRDDTWVYHEF